MTYPLNLRVSHVKRRREYLTNDTCIYEINIQYDCFQKKSVPNFTPELNKNNKISFLDVLIDTNNNNNFTASTHQKPSNNNSCTLNFKSECPFRCKKKAINNNLISCAKLISSSKTIFYKEIKSIKRALINNGFPNYIVEQNKRIINYVSQKNKHCNTPPNKQTFIKLFTATKCTTIIN